MTRNFENFHELADFYEIRYPLVFRVVKYEFMVKKKHNLKRQMQDFKMVNAKFQNSLN